MNRWQSIISAAVVIIVQVAALYGMTLDPDTVASVITVAAAVVVMLWALWKNHNFTSAAQEAQKFLKGLKDGGLAGMPSDTATDPDIPSQEVK
jgi:hypothetical protein